MVCEGMPGVSDVYASALWAIDAQLDFAREGASGYYMHGTVLQCDTGKPLFMYYTPRCALRRRPTRVTEPSPRSRSITDWRRFT